VYLLCELALQRKYALFFCLKLKFTQKNLRYRRFKSHVVASHKTKDEQKSKSYGVTVIVTGSWCDTAVPFMDDVPVTTTLVVPVGVLGTGGGGGVLLPPPPQDARAQISGIIKMPTVA
jgi:hypothetical protein